MVLARASEHIQIVDHAFAAELVVDGGRVVGLTARIGRDKQLLVTAPAVVLATGGVGRLYANTTNPPAITGDGLAMASRAGARLRDIEFVQFHPTALATGRDPMSLLTEALRGEGAVLLDEAGRRFMVDEHEDAELAPARRGGPGQLAGAAARRPGLPRRHRRRSGRHSPSGSPRSSASAWRTASTPGRTRCPAAPAAHYHMGGISTDLGGRSTLPGLWAVGEAARTGVHGANRLASNSLLEGAVFGRRAALDIKAGVRRCVGGCDGPAGGRGRPAPNRTRNPMSSPNCAI